MEYALGIDIGGTSVKLAIIDAAGIIAQQRSIPTVASEGSARVVSDIASAVSDMRAALPSGAIIVGAGVGAPGSVDGRVLQCAVNLGWSDIPLADALEKPLGVPVVLVNDANAAAVGECWAISLEGGADVRNALFVTLGTGVGGGIIVNGELVTGEHACGGEIGHIPTGLGEGRVCGCGNIDCLECYASATGLLETARKMSEAHDGEPPQSCEEVFSRVAAGDSSAVAALNVAVTALARALAGIINAVDVRDVIVGGGLSNAGDALMTPLAAEVDRMVFPALRGKYALCRARLGNDAGVYGGAREAFKLFSHHS